MASEGMNKLARVLETRAKEHGDKPPVLDFGTIQSDMSLLTNFFPLPIPQSDYVVCRSVQWGAAGDIFYRTQDSGKINSGEHGHEGGGHSHPLAGFETHIHVAEAEGERHVHDTIVGPKFRWLMPGDRVLVAWVGARDADSEAVVIDIIYPATRIGRDADGHDK